MADVVIGARSGGSASEASCQSTSISLMLKSGSATPELGFSNRNTIPQATRRKLNIGHVPLRVALYSAFRKCVERSFMAIYGNIPHSERDWQAG
jgi:hypothetical protein